MTLNALLRCRYFLEDGTAIDIDKKRLLDSMKRTNLFVDEQVSKLKKWEHGNNDDNDHHANAATQSVATTPVANRVTFIGVMNGDCAEAAVAMQSAFKQKTAMLNMASDTNRGGGWMSGAGAQVSVSV
jgi:hypothetical protein